MCYCGRLPTHDGHCGSFVCGPTRPPDTTCTNPPRLGVRTLDYHRERGPGPVVQITTRSVAGVACASLGWMTTLSQWADWHDRAEAQRAVDPVEEETES